MWLLNVLCDEWGRIHKTLLHSAVHWVFQGKARCDAGVVLFHGTPFLLEGITDRQN